MLWVMYQTYAGTVESIEVQPIHGVHFYTLTLRSPDGLRRIRVQDTLTPKSLKVGYSIEVDVLLGNVTEIRILSAE